MNGSGIRLVPLLAFKETIGEQSFHSAASQVLALREFLLRNMWCDGRPYLTSFVPLNK